MANGIGQTRGGRNTKLHAVCDVKGRPCVLLLTPGNAHDMRVAQQCIAAMPPSAELVGDKGYDSNDLRAWLASRVCASRRTCMASGRGRRPGSAADGRG